MMWGHMPPRYIYYINSQNIYNYNARKRNTLTKYEGNLKEEYVCWKSL